MEGGCQAPHYQGTRGKRWGEGDPGGMTPKKNHAQSRVLALQCRALEHSPGPELSSFVIGEECALFTAPWLPLATLFPRRRCHPDPHPLQPWLFWATLPNMGTSHWTPRLPLRMAGEAPKGVASGRGQPALATRPQAQGTSSPSHPSLPVCWDIPWETQLSRSRHKEGDFNLFLAWTEHLTMRTSREFGWQTFKEGKRHLMGAEREQAGMPGWQGPAAACQGCLGTPAHGSQELPTAQHFSA